MRLFGLLILFTSLVSCSSQHLSQRKGSSLSDYELKEKIAEIKSFESELKNKDKPTTLEESEKLLSEVVALGKKRGPDMVEFLASDLFLKANDASYHGNSQLASLLYTYLLKLKPNDSFIMKKAAVESIRLGKFEEAEKILAYFYKQEGPKNLKVSLMLAGIYSFQSKMKEAKKIYSAIINSGEKSIEACMFLAKINVQEDNFKEAIKALDGCEKKMKGEAAFAHYRGRIYLKQNKVKEARKQFNLALKIDPAYYQAVLDLGMLKEEKEDFVGASKIYLKFLKKNPKSFTILSKLVDIYFALGKFKTVIPYAEELSNLDPSDLNLKVKLGILYTDVKDYLKAISIFKEVLHVVPESDKVLYYLGSLHQLMNKYEDGIEYFNRIPETSSLFQEGHLQIAQMLHVMARRSYDGGDKEGSHVSRFIDFVSNSKVEDLKVEMAMILAGFFEGNRNYEGAIGQLEGVSQNNNFSEGHFYYLASLYEKNQKLDKAYSIIRGILDKNPENSHALNFLGYSLLENDGDMKQAYEYISKAVQLNPKDGYIRDSLGWYYYKNGEHDKALKELEKAVSLVKDDVVITKHLAIVYMKINRLEKAKKLFVEALKNCKQEDERADILKNMELLDQKRLPASEQKEIKK